MKGSARVWPVLLRHMASCYGYNIIIWERESGRDIYIILMLRWYNCTDIYMVKYRKSIAFSYIYIGGHFSWFLWGRKVTKDLRKVAQVAVCRRSEHHAVFTGCHQRCPHYCLRRGTGATLSMENAPVLFAACPVCGFPTYNLRSTAEINGQE